MTCHNCPVLKAPLIMSKLNFTVKPEMPYRIFMIRHRGCIWNWLKDSLHTFQRKFCLLHKKSYWDFGKSSTSVTRTSTEMLLRNTVLATKGKDILIWRKYKLRGQAYFKFKQIWNQILLLQKHTTNNIDQTNALLFCLVSMCFSLFKSWYKKIPKFKIGYLSSYNLFSRVKVLSLYQNPIEYKPRSNIQSP